MLRPRLTDISVWVTPPFPPTGSPWYQISTTDRTHAPPWWWRPRGLAFDAALFDFDFDGTLVQSEPLHRLAFSEVLGKEIIGLKRL